MTYEVDDDIYPATTGIYIEATWYGYGTYTGSGVLVGRNDILTAAHVVYDPIWGIADDIVLYPSYDPDDFSNDTVEWSTVHYFPDFDPDADGRLYWGDFNSGTLGETELDIALFTLSEAAGDVYGWMGMDYGFNGGNVGVLGYPGIYGRQPMYDTGSVSNAPFNDYAFLYNGDLEVNSGNSGGPIFYDYGDGPYVVGIVSTGIAAVDIAGHEYWLRDYIRDNDVALSGGRFDPTSSGSTVTIDLVEDGVYRFYNSSTGTHFYTSAYAEATSINTSSSQYSYEGVAYKSVDSTGSNAVEFYRFYNTDTGTHFFTASATERDSVISTLPQFNYEGVAYHLHSTADADDIALYRFFNTETGTHFYTAVQAERDSVINTLSQYTYEGIVGYVDIA
ncbi:MULTISPECIES: trypsin-like peptidase domain-containing protein [unclassified Roseibium]|uniref:trypsin-like peptidase domain-containing protein n=1 Tax=unclassified Roseibium TaxID=2629323 RepID=UPI00273E8310|nr:MULTISPECIES: trypsin-like peptidase domain-containing protein [unclassified Roseibium]